MIQGTVISVLSLIQQARQTMGMKVIGIVSIEIGLTPGIPAKSTADGRRFQNLVGLDKRDCSSCSSREKERRNKGVPYPHCQDDPYI